jgi:hypothetical protein
MNRYQFEAKLQSNQLASVAIQAGSQQTLPQNNTPDCELPEQKLPQQSHSSQMN